jgi:hypothetical protein
VTPECKWYVERFVQAFVDAKDELVVELHKELNESQDLFIEVWGVLPATMRRQIKQIVDDQ